MKKRIEARIREYRARGIHMAHDESVLQYIQAHLHLLQDRPQTFRHGDYHVGNPIYRRWGS